MVSEVCIRYIKRGGGDVINSYVYIVRISIPRNLLLILENLDVQRKLVDKHHGPQSLSRELVRGRVESSSLISLFRY